MFLKKKKKNLWGILTFLHVKKASQFKKKKSCGKLGHLRELVTVYEWDYC